MPELDALVDAFADGDFKRVRSEAPKLAAESADEDVKRAALTLRARIDADPVAIWLLAFAGALLVFLSGWWIAHDNMAPPARVPATSSPPAPAVTVEHVR